MKRRIVAVALAFIMVLGVLPVTASTAEAAGTHSNYKTISQKTYEIAPGITEYEIYKNTEAMDTQQAAHAMVITADSLKDGTSQVKVGYNDYNLDNIASGNGWGMKKTTEQAQAMETRTHLNVVGAVNGDFFNMSNGQPTGVFVLSGKIIQKTNSSNVVFWVDKDKTPHITDYNSIDWTTIQEGLGGNTWLVRDGQAVAGEDNTKNPRTAIGLKSDGSIVIFMVNGRQAPFSEGMTLPELANEMLDLGCVVAMNLDGGGSSTFATQRAGESNESNPAGLTVRCRPSDGYERTVSSTLMVVSEAFKDGKFTHATISPYEEIYTPGSEVQFTATGVDAGGGPADLPGDLIWSVEESNIGFITDSGLFTGAEDATGTATIVLSQGGEEVGKTTIQLQWPDELGFTNPSVSLDFGESSDLTFNPTYQGREVHYKDGDFEWSVDPEYYKHFVNVEKYYYPGWLASGVDHWMQIQIALTGAQGNEVTGEYRVDAGATYVSRYTEESVTVSTLDNGTVQATETVKHVKATAYSNTDITQVLKDNIIADFDETTGDPKLGVQGLKSEFTETFDIASFNGNIFKADDSVSLRGSISVQLANNPGDGPTGSIDVVVGLEPTIIMDFEGHDSKSAEEYWTLGVNNTMPSELTQALEFRNNNRIWVREVNSRGRWPSKSEDGFENELVNKEEDSNVRFGDYAMRLAWDYTGVDKSVVAAACFGFSTALMIDDTQPTKIGVWINVPRDLAESESIVKGIFVAGASVTESEGNYYWKLDENNELEKVEGHALTGTTSYVQYYSYDSEGNVTGETLGDWAGDGWTWIEADVSSLQFPLEIQIGYSVRIVSAQNKVKDKGYVLIDNLQLIYGTNTNDINNPVIESVKELSGTNTELTTGGSTTFSKNDLSFEVLYNDSASTDKYASGIDLSNTKVFIDGVDITNEENVKVNETNMVVPVAGLVNGTHILKVQLRDKYGNSTTQSYTFEVDVEEGQSAELSVVGAPTAKIGQNYVIQIGNATSLDNVGRGIITLQIPAAYAKDGMFDVKAADGYTATHTLDTQASTLTITAGLQNLMTASLVDNPDLKTIATVAFHIPDTAQKGDTFKFSVPAANYVDKSGQNEVTFAQPEDTVTLVADYGITVDRAIQGLQSVIKVIDETTGAPVPGATVKFYGDSEQTIGTTGEDGTVQYTFTNAGSQVIYATTDGGRSWNTPVVVSSQSTDETAIYKIQNNAIGDGSTTRSMTWLSLVNGNDTADTKLRYADTEAGLESGTVVTGTNKIVSFTGATSGVAYRLNTVKLTGLTPNTTYYYQVQKDANTWTDALSFTTSSDNKEGETSFFVFADIQATSLTNLNAAIKAVSGKEDKGLPTYSFGIQTGDAIDQVTEFNTYWRPFFTEMNADALGSIDVLHTMGNHEYYGDNDGLIAGSIFDLPKTKQGTWYSVEYGSVYAAVVNNGGDRIAALTEIAQDAAKSDCAWKILVLHEPIYGTTDDMDETTRQKYTSLIEEAGFSLVFSGDDHSYARTYPMLGGEKLDETSSNGVVYYISGDLSNKDNEFHEHDHFANAIPHTAIAGGKDGYGNLFLSVTANADEISVSAYKVPGFELVETYTRMRSDCQKGNHTFDSDSKYDMATGKLVCSVCEKASQTPEATVYGLYETTDGGLVVLSAGNLVTDNFSMIGADMYHSCADGYAHRTEDNDPRTCTTGGYITYTCPKCGQSKQSEDYQMPVGHQWNENHVCTVCGKQGKSIEDADVIVNFGTVQNPRTGTDTPRYILISGGVRPSAFVSVDGGKTALTYSNDDTLINGRIRDIKISWLGNNQVGEATIEFVGRGDYYGTRTLTYTIIPGTVENLSSAAVGSTSVSLSWKAALGAEYYQVYQCDKNGNIIKEVANTSKTYCEVTELEYDTEYFFKAAARTTVGKETYTSAYWSNILSVTTLGDPALDSRNYITGGNVENNGKTYYRNLIDGTWYYFLPSSADLGSVELDIQVTDEAENVIVSGSIGSQALDGSSGTVDLTALTAGSDGSYSIFLQYGETRSKIAAVIMKSENIPALFLTSKVYGQDRSYVDASKSHSTTADMELVGADGSVIYSGALTQLKARGNSTFTYAENKSYQIKLATATDLLGTEEAVKTWVLLAGYSDATKIHDKTFKDFASELGMPYVADSEWVDLYYDGEYRGTYLLSEKNSVSPTSVDITDMEAEYELLNENYGVDPAVKTGTNAYGQEYYYTDGLAEPENITGGYLIEINNDGIDEASGFKTSKGRTINVKSPEYAGKEAMEYISEYYQEFENAVYAVDENGNYTGFNEKTGKYYYDYVDLDSLIQVFLLQELALNPDGFRSSVYFYKDADGIMYAGPIWDNDLVFGTGWEKYIPSDVLDYHYLEDALIQIPSFKEALKKYYAETFAPAARELIAANGTVDTYLDVIRESVRMNNMLWPLVKVSNPSHAEHFWPDGTTYEDVTNTMKDWIVARLNFMDTLYKETPNVPSAPRVPGASETVTNPDGSKTTTKKNADGSTTETTKQIDGTVTEKVTQKDGSATEKTTTSEGVTGQVDTNAKGEVTSVEVVIPEDAGRNGTVTAPVEIPAVKDSADAPEISVKTGSAQSTKVEIPVTEFGPGTVAVLVHPDGTEEIVRDCVTGENGVVLNVEGDVTLKIVDNTKTFSDVESVNHWATGAVEFVAARELFNGTGDGVFSPEDDMTRGMLVTVLYRLNYEPEAVSGDFVDVDASAYYADAVAWAESAGVVGGYGNGKFGPEDDVTREQIVTILYRYAKENGYQTGKTGSLTGYADAGSVSGWAADAMSWAVNTGLVQGVDSTHLAPTNNATRAEVATILMRFCEDVMN